MLRKAFILLIAALVFSWVDLVSSTYAQSPKTDRRIYGAANCRVEIPKAWNDIGPVTWIGRCRNSYADGLGVLRRADISHSADLFLGRVDQGLLRSGALDLGGGYQVGRWEGGTVTPSNGPSNVDDFTSQNEELDAFRNAEKAANATAKSLKRRSDLKAARFYTRLANHLRMQMGD